MEDRSIHDVLEKVTWNLKEAIADLAVKKHFGAMLIVAYSALDIVSSLSRPPDQRETSGDVFKSWVERFLIPNLHADGITAEDLWGARCGILHTYSPKSGLSRSGSARPIHYVHGGWSLDFYRAWLDERGDEDSTAMHANEFAIDVMDAIRSYQDELRVDEELRKRAELRQNDLFITRIANGQQG